MCLHGGSARHLDGTDGLPASDTAAAGAPWCFPGRGTTRGPSVGFASGREGPPQLGAERWMGVPWGHITWDEAGPQPSQAPSRMRWWLAGSEGAGQRLGDDRQAALLAELREIILSILCGFLHKVSVLLLIREKLPILQAFGSGEERVGQLQLLRHLKCI